MLAAVTIRRLLLPVLLTSSTLAYHGPFTVGVFLRSPEGRRGDLEQRAVRTANPESASYGQYMSQKELDAAIGVPPAAAHAAASWLRSAFNVSEVLKDPHIVSHRDAVTLDVSDFSATYRLGSKLQHENVPPTMELLVTPPMPEHYCHGFSEEGEASCISKQPCHWNSTSSGKGRCKGDFSGWICWPTQAVFPAAWRCFEPTELQAGNQTLISGPWHQSIKRRRRGRRWDIDSPLDRQTSATTLSTLGFSVIPHSEGLILRSMHLVERSWQSVEVSFRQNAAYQTLTLQRADFSTFDNRIVFTKIEGVANLRPVDQIMVCLNAGENAYLTAASLSAEWTRNPLSAGCKCNESLGTDNLLGRPCQVLRGSAPRKTPIDFVTPRAAQTLSALQHDMGMSRASRAGGGTPLTAQAVGEFIWEDFSQADTMNMQQAYGLSARKAVLQGPNGKAGEGVNADTAGEGSLDLQVITTLASGSPTTWWSVNPYTLDGFMLAYALQVNDHPEPPLVHSISWGDAEALFPPAFVKRLDYELMKMALRGITTLIASGDNGISSTSAQCAFVPDLVGSSPWVTTVGATQPSLEAAPFCSSDKFGFLGTCEERGQVTCSTASGAIITSSGYWSIYRAQPDYQSAAIAEYLQVKECNPCRTNGNQSASEKDLWAACPHLDEQRCNLAPLFGATRASPDVSAPGSHFPVMINGSVTLFDGTSASSPAFGAMVTLLNTEQLRRGRPPLGLLNPWLYSTFKRHPEAFVDVVVGDNGATEEQTCPWGFRAFPGWDAATGLGVPLFDVLLAHLPTAGKPQHANLSGTKVSVLAVQPNSGLHMHWTLLLAALMVVALTAASSALVLARLRPQASPRFGGARSPLLQ